MIKRCSIIPINEHVQYYNRTDTDVLKELGDFSSPEYVLDSANCYAELKVIVTRTPTKTCMNEFHKTCNVCAAFKKLKFTFIGPSFTQQCTVQFEDKCVPSSIRDNPRPTAPRPMLSTMRRSISKCFLNMTDKSSLKIAVQIYESQFHYSNDFYACASYLTSMVQKTPVAKRVHIAAAVAEADGIKLKNLDGTDQCIPAAKLLRSIYKLLSAKQKEWLWQDCKKSNADWDIIPGAKGNWGEPPIKQAQCLVSLQMDCPSHCSEPMLDYGSCCIGNGHSWFQPLIQWRRCQRLQDGNKQE